MVTGGGSGIGRAVAVKLAQAGYVVTVAGRHAETLAGTVAAAGTADGEIIPVTADVCDPASVRGLFANAKASFGRLDVLINNAGLFGPSVPLEDVSAADWLSVIATNLTGTFLCTQEAVKLMKSQVPRGGRIINNGSVAAHVPRPNSAAYAAAKHGISGLTKATALEGRAYDIACGQIDIGNASTEMTQSLASGVRQPDETVLGEPRIDVIDVAQGISYMAGLPLEANVLFMTIIATKMPYVGRG
jgi:NAD(P)-dependent dehydrogenase (short-subunit alcohol dehydrogenase family)